MKLEIPAKVAEVLSADPVKIRALTQAEYNQLRDLICQHAHIGVEELDAMRSGD